MLQLHKILIGLIIVGFFAVSIMTYISQGSILYESDIENFNITTYNKMQDLNLMVEDFKDKENTQVDSSILDILGSFFTNMYQSAKTLRGSVDVASSMTDDVINAIPFENSNILKTAINLILLVVIFVGIFLAFVTKSERT